MTDKTAAELLNEFLDEHESLGDFLRIPNLIKNHLTKITKDRSIVLSGDTGHLSIDYIINTSFKNIDKPRKYDFQKEDVHEEQFLRELMRFVPDFSAELTRENVDKAIAGEEALVIPGNRFNSVCYDCAAVMNLSIQGKHIHLSCDSECEHNRKFTIEVDFPTGEVVFDDWPARFSEARDAGFIAEDDEGVSINYLKGQRQRSDEMAAQQIVHHSVGNTCPGFYVNKETSAIQIGGGKYNEETDEYEVAEGLEDVGTFCTDLWWVTMLDRKFYDAIVTKLPTKKSKKYYDKELHIAHIPPGRYRFTCYGRTNDDNEVFMTGERIGDASDYVPPFDITANKRLMTLDEAVAERGHGPTHKDSATFNFLDYTFNVIGNGIRSKGEFLSKFSVPMDTVIEPLAPSEEPISKKNPYPNFKQEYSLVYQMPIADIPTDWLEGLLWYYEECKVYFLNGAEGYSSAYPSKQNRDDELAKYIERYRKEGQTEEEYFAAVSEAYGTEFRGDIPDFQTRRWEAEKARILAFIDSTLSFIKEELDTRS